MRSRMNLGAMLLMLAACGPSEGGGASGPEVPPVPTVNEEAVASANMLTPEEIGARLVGAFTSADDHRSSITITSSGQWTDSYDGAETGTSRWRVFTGADAPADTGYAFTSASRYLEVTGDSGPLYYELGMISDDGFDMFYLGRGNMLVYVRTRVPA